MLKLEFKIPEMGYKSNTMYSDIEDELRGMKLIDTPIVRYLLKEIEHGKYCDADHFIDRFGDKRDKLQMSTGCRAAIFLATKPPKAAIDITEVGPIAQDIIIQYCKAGYILVPEKRDITYDTNRKLDEAIDVEFDGFRFTNIERLNSYLRNDFLFTDAEDILENPEEYGIEEIPGAKHLTIRGAQEVV